MRRLGRKKIPVYSIIATDSRNARDGRYIEDLGRYYPLREPAEVKLDEERALYWLKNGAQPSDTVHSILHRRGILLQHHLQKKGESPDEIQKQVEELRERMAAEGKEIKMVVQSRGEDALQKERERAEELDEEAQLRAQATSIPVDDAVVQEEEGTAADETQAEANAQEDTDASAEADDAGAEEDAEDEKDE
jgi:small subunit ribosomal protein S16